VLDENPGPSPDCTDAGWYQDNVLVACQDERSAALYKAAINKVGDVYPGAKLAVCEAEDIPSRPIARVLLPSEPSESGAILSLLTRFNPKLPTDGWKVAPCASYEPPSDGKMEHEEGTHTGYVSTDSELTESLRQVCSQNTTRPVRTVFQDIAEEAEGTQPRLRS